MAKYNVKFSCGHEETVEVFGSDNERKSKIAYFEQKGLCAKCYAEQQERELSSQCIEVEMSYSDYKKNYSTNKTKKDSYNAKTKTIVVFVEKEKKSSFRYTRSQKVVLFKKTAQELFNDTLNAPADRKAKFIATLDQNEGEGWTIEILDELNNVYATFDKNLMLNGKGE